MWVQLPPICHPTGLPIGVPPCRGSLWTGVWQSLRPGALPASLVLLAVARKMGKGGAGKGWGSSGGRGWDSWASTGGGGWGSSSGAGGAPAAGRWGGRGGGGGGKIPWSFVHVCDDRDSLGLLALSQQIPDEWIDWRHGGRRQRDRMHSTVLLKMTELAHLQRLRRLAQGTAPLQVEVRELFCEQVERIKDAEVYCIGVALASPSLRALKDAWCAEEADDRRTIHVPYASEGHISLAYIKAEYQQVARTFVEKHAAAVQGGRSLQVDHITYEDEWGKALPIALAGGGAGEGPKQKGARRGPVTPVSRGPPKEIDGSVLEGGGQILRMSSSYSALFGVPIHITRIRAGRSKPGLAAQHLESLRLVRDVSAGMLTNDWVGSCDITLKPSELSAGSFSADPGTAGAITLMVQASLFPLLFAGGDSKCDLKGGTDVSFSPPLHFLQHVLKPNVERMGAALSVDCLLRGFFPVGGGHVQLSVSGLNRPLSPIDLSDRGEVARVEVVIHATKPMDGEESAAVNAVREVLSDLAPEVRVEFSVSQARNAFKCWLDVVVVTTTGALFHAGTEPKDLPGYGKSRGKGKGGGSLSEMLTAAAREAAGPLRDQLATGAAVDCHLADQIILPASLAAGKSSLLVAALSLHAKTAIHIAELLVPGVKFHQETRGTLSLLEIEGIGHCPGSEAPTAAAEPTPSRAVPRAPVARTDEEIITLAPGSLSKAKPEMMGDFRNDMSQLAEFVGATVDIDAVNDRLVVRGGPRERKEAQAELEKVLEFYFGGR